MTPREHAIDLMRAVVAEELTVESFCLKFETHYNFNWPFRHTVRDIAIFEALFDIVVYHTPFPEEKKTVYVGYKTDSEVLDAVHRSLAALIAQPDN